MHPELLKGHLDALLLAVLEPDPQHGYAVIESLRAGSGDTLDLPIGKVYPALHRLEPAGLIAGDWQTVAGRRHRAYHLSSRRHCARRASRRVGPVLHRRHCPPEQANVASSPHSHQHLRAPAVSARHAPLRPRRTAMRATASRAMLSWPWLRSVLRLSPAVSLDHDAVGAVDIALCERPSG